MKLKQILKNDNKVIRLPNGRRLDIKDGIVEVDNPRMIKFLQSKGALRRYGFLFQPMAVEANVIETPKSNKIGFITFGQLYPQKSTWSSRVRIGKMLKYMENGELYQKGQEYKCIVYQKVYDLNHAKGFDGLKILDVCDADWIAVIGSKFWKMCQLMDAIVCTNEMLKKDIEKNVSTPIYVVRDRHELNDVKIKKEVHAKDAEWAVWYGYDGCFPALDSMYDLIKKHGYRLKVVAPRPYDKADMNILWEQETYLKEIIKADILVNPHTDDGHFKYKSDNKTTLSWACGMPVALNEKDLIRFKSLRSRKTEVAKRLKSINEYHISKSAEEYTNIINSAEMTKGKRLVIYTIITNNYDVLKDPESTLDGADYICFTDNKNSIKSNAYKVIEMPDNSTLTFKRYKICPHLIKGLRGYDFSLYHDGNFQLTKNVDLFLSGYDYNKIGIFKHWRKCVYEEIEAIKMMIRNGETRGGTMHQVLDSENYIKSIDFPKKFGLWACGILLRSLKNPIINKANEKWYELLKKINYRRDQLAFAVMIKEMSLKDNLVASTTISNSRKQGFRNDGHNPGDN